jgi:hypothetical protein
LTFLIIFKTKDEPLDDPQDGSTIVVVRAPWGSDIQGNTNSIELTACGGMMLAGLVARGFIKPGPLMRWVRNTALGAYSIKDIVEGFEMEELPDVLREALLTFNEPGIG